MYSCKYKFLLTLLLFSGTDQVVLGDLVYSNEETAYEVKQIHDSEPEEIEYNDLSENNHPDEADAHASEGNFTSVKVRWYLV